jgi:cytochrome c biogenesis protein
MAKKAGGIWGFLTSIRLAMVLLVAIALGSLLGTLIPQQEAAQSFAARVHPSFFAVLQALQLFNVYGSVWFILLLTLLAVNLVACSASRFPAAWRQFRGGEADAPALFAALPPGRTVETDRPPAEETGRIESLLKRRCGRLQRTEVAGGFLIFGEKGRFSRFGVTIVHLGVLAMIAGGLVGGVFGVKGYVEIAEEEASSTLQLRGGKPARTLDYSIRCDRFTVEHYENGAPKLFRSDLSFLKEGRVVYQGPLTVNHPIAFGGLRFYQASYGVIPGGRMKLAYARGNQKGAEREVSPGERFDLPGSEGQVEVLRAEENLMQMGPAVKLAVRSPRGDFQFWVFQNIERIKEANPGILTQVPLMNPGLFAPYLFSLQQGGGRFYTVLQAAHDPGAPLVAAGGSLMIAGLLTVFFFSHRRIRLKVEAHRGGSRIGVAGTSNRDPVGLEAELDRLVAEIRQGGKSG